MHDMTSINTRFVLSMRVVLSVFILLFSSHTFIDIFLDPAFLRTSDLSPSTTLALLPYRTRRTPLKRLTWTCYFGFNERPTDRILIDIMDRCVNCGIATSRCNTLGRRALDDEMILAAIRKWREPQSVSTYSLTAY